MSESLKLMRFLFVYLLVRKQYQAARRLLVRPITEAKQARESRS